jgi:O-antigen/teichoic acid export membrane protein
MTGRQNTEVVNSGALLFLNISLNYILIPLYGALGAAIATAISISSVNFLRLMEVYFIFRIHPYNRSYIKGLFSGGLGLGLLFFWGSFFRYSGFERLLMNIIVIGLSFGVPFYIAGIDEEDKFVLKALAKKLTHNSL